VTNEGDLVRDKGRLIGAALVLLIVTALLFPELFRLSGVSPFTQLVAFRPQGLVLVALGGALIAVRRPGRVLGALVLALAALAAALTAPRVFSEAAATPPEQRERTVLAANLLGGGADLGQVAALIREHRPVFVSLPEATEEVRRELEAELAGAGYRGYTHQPRGYPVSATSVLVAESLGEVRFRPGGSAGGGPETEFGNVTVTGGALGESRLVAYHPHPPVPSGVGTWRRDLEALNAWCGTGRVIVAGDFNATLDHTALRDSLGSCRSVAGAVGKGLEGTWPAGRPAVLRTPIDHVVVSADLTPRSFSTHHLDGTDHRAVLAAVATPY
jgi:endonuclease/exonuclease/phosphatase (EEP) superfamily protein YafD